MVCEKVCVKMYEFFRHTLPKVCEKVYEKRCGFFLQQEIPYEKFRTLFRALFRALCRAPVARFLARLSRTFRAPFAYSFTRLATHLFHTPFL